MCIPITRDALNTDYTIITMNTRFGIIANNFRAVRGVGASHTRPVSQAIGRFVLRLCRAALFLPNLFACIIP